MAILQGIASSESVKLRHSPLASEKNDHNLETVQDEIS